MNKNEFFERLNTHTCPSQTKKRKNTMRFIVVEIESKPTADFTVENHGSIVLLRPNTEAAREWLDEHISDDAQTFGNAIAIEPRYVGDILYGIEGDGLTYDGV